MAQKVNSFSLCHVSYQLQFVFAMKSSGHQLILMVIVHFMLGGIYRKIGTELSETEEILGENRDCKEKKGMPKQLSVANKLKPQ